MTDFLRKISAIFWKDVLAELRTKETIFSVLVFAILVIVIFDFAFDASSETLKNLAPGVLWVAFTFAGILSLNRSFAREKERGCLEGLIMCPVDRTVIYTGKMMSCLVFMLIVEIIVIPVFSVLFDLPLFLPRLWLIVFLATLGFAGVGTVFSALAVHTKSRDIMLPVLFFPIVVPLIITATEATKNVFLGTAWSDLTVQLAIIGAFDIIFLIVPALMFEFILEE